MFSKDCQLHWQRIDDRSECLIVDHVLQEPERWVERAASVRSAFAQEDFNAFPGPELRLPDEVTQQLVRFFDRHARARLGAEEVVRAYSRLALVALPVSSLMPRQWICHRDRLANQPGQCVAASVLYLFDQPALGGTAFFRPKKSAAETALLIHDSSVLSEADFSARYGLTQGYPQDNPWFEKLASIPARFNRMIFYDGSLFHCSDIRNPDLLSADPALGRLTLNGFFTCRQSLR